MATGWQWEWKVFKQNFKMWGRRNTRSFLVTFGGVKERERETESKREISEMFQNLNVEQVGKVSVIM